MVDADKRVQDIIREAKSKKFWIYDPSYKHWYAPEDFEHIFPKYAKGDEDFYNRLQIRNPNDGIQAGFKILEDTQEKLKNFINRVTNYYKK